MASKQVRQRKGVQSEFNKNGKRDDADGEDESGIARKSNNEEMESEVEEEDGIDWRCAALILTLVFILVFVGSISWGTRGIFPNLMVFTKAPDDKEQPMVAEDFDYADDDVLHDIPREELLRQSRENFEQNRKETPKPELDKPTILWWTDALYPHAHRGPVSEITCGEHTCLSTSDKRVLPDPLTRGIMFYGTDFRAYEAPLPRQPWHEWALLHEESPMNNYALIHSTKLFNHSATFKRESDYPTTTHSLPNLEFLTERMPVPIEEKNRLRKEQKLAPILYVQSHCDVASDRDRFVKELMKHIKVDSYGKCANNKKMPVHLNNPVESMEAEQFYDFISRYKFHLAFENAICDDYITEKFFRPFHVGSVPIYKGSSTARDWAPSMKSFVNLDQFESPQQLAYFIKLLDEHDDVYLNHLTWKETGVTNPLLLEHMNNRPYAVNEWNKHSFISGFECHVCEKISERYKAEREGVESNHPALEKKIGQSSIMGCPPPYPSVGKIEDIPETEGIHTWIQDYWGMRDQAIALEHMIKSGEKDSSKLFEVIERIYNERQRREI